jgi:hypothetical protein
VAPKEGTLEANSTTCVQLAFTPDKADAYMADLVVDYTGGQKVISIRGKS